MEYNTGNIDKYMTTNPLKKALVVRLNHKVLGFIKEALRLYDKSYTVRILDAGCGEGFVSNLIHSSFNNVEIVGLEYTSEAIKIAREMNPDISFVQGDIKNMPFEEDSFDIVICTEVLEHIINPSIALNELLRVAKNSIIITVPNEPWFRIGNMIVLKNITRFGDPIDHVNHWSYSGFLAFLNSYSNVKWKMDKSFPWTIARCVVNER